MWICCQIGAREHYAVPRALKRAGVLQGLFTDAWVRPGNPLGLVKRSLRERYHDELKEATVISANASLLAFEALARVKGLTGWNLILARNQWFQRQALHALEKQKAEFEGTVNTSAPVLFAYSYAAREPFRWAKEQGWRKVLGQIDAGPEMRRIVQRLEQRYPEYQSRNNSPSKSYWNEWREECALADRIIVNSQWSLKALEIEGINAAKIRVVPLAYAAPLEAAIFRREYPAAFSAQRPMRVLFLGQVNLAKGLIPMLEAADLLRSEPIEFYIVGQIQVAVPEKWRRQPRIHWLGPVSRGMVAKYYQSADIFLFPTFCDGFGLTQLEAQAWQLPIVASRFCGDVVKDEINGLQLTEVSGEDIAHALRRLLTAPEKLSAMSRYSNLGPQFSLKGIAAGLETVLD